MATSYDIWQNFTLRASAATSGGSEQDSAVTIVDSATSIWVLVTKTAEANVDNLLTVRLQGQVNSIWFDVAWSHIQVTGDLATFGDTVTNVTRAVNIVEQSSVVPTWSVLAYYSELPSNILRVASVSSGTAVANTFSVEAYVQRIAT